MSAPATRGAAGARAARLLRWYPEAWRSRYGEEFTELLIADIAERPRARSRTADVLRHQTRLAVAACAAMAVFLAAGGAWIADRTPRPGNLFHAGAIDVAGLVVMTLALAVGQQAARRARAAGR